MNIALPAILIFIILLPGFVARSRLKRVERTIIDHSPFGHAMAEGVLLAALLHLLWIAGVEYLTQWRFTPERLLPLISADQKVQAPALEALAQHFNQVAFYFLSLLFGSYAIPSAVRRLTTRYRLDIHDHPFSRMLRFNGAPWYYLLSGADFEEDRQPDLIAVSALVDVAGDAYLYLGLLEDFFVDQEGNLDRLILSEVMRRPMSKDKGQQADGSDSQRFYPIDGDYFVLRYSEAITLNVEYIKLEAVTSGTKTKGELSAPSKSDAPVNV